MKQDKKNSSSSRQRHEREDVHGHHDNMEPAAVDASMGTHITMTNMSINTSQRNLAAVDANMVIHIIMTNMTMWGMIMGTGNPIIRKVIRLTVSVNCVILTRDTVISVVRALQTASAICLTLTVKRKFIS